MNYYPIGLLILVVALAYASMNNDNHHPKEIAKICLHTGGKIIDDGETFRYCEYPQ